VPTLDFKEIPEANSGSGLQDTFELFSRDFLQHLDLKVVEEPGRGADGGKDLIVEEQRNGAIGTSTIRWLVSCKHFAHSGRSVGGNDEINILERVSAAGCSGFFGFYSTIPSAALNTLLKSGKIETRILDHEAIEHALLRSPSGRQLAERYFPLSSQRLKPIPAQLFDEMPEIRCEYCGKHLLDPPSGIYVMWRATEAEFSSTARDHYVDLHFSCKGHCDEEIEQNVRQRHNLVRLVNSWDDITDMCTPTVYIRHVMSIINDLHAESRYETEPFEKLKQLFIAIFPHVSRHMNHTDDVLMARLRRIPSELGGMGGL
jgi:hypothetical protein